MWLVASILYADLSMTKVGVYFQSWSSAWASHNLDLERVEGDVVYLAFANPNCNYSKGQKTFGGTGLDFSSDFKVVADAIVSLKSRGVIVMLSIGGATFGFETIRVENIIALVTDLGCDGIDIDWEPTYNNPEMFATIVNKFAGKTKYLSAAVFSIGAYGQGQWKDSQPQGMYTGLNRQGLIQVGDKLDWINIMAYDASPVFNPTEAFAAYQSIYKKDIYLGFEVGQQAWGEALLTLDQVKTWGHYVLAQNGHFFVWSWQKPGNPNALGVIQTLKSIGTSVPPVVPPTVPPVVIEPEPPVITIPITDIPSDDPNCKCTCHQGSTTWSAWVAYKQNDAVTYQSIKYKCVQSHQSQPDWTPPAVPALWSKTM